MGQGVHTSFVLAVKCPKLYATTSTSSPQSALPTARSSQSKNDLRSTSGLGLGDGLTDHTSKWMSEKGPSPMELIARVPPKKVHTPVVACFGHPDPNLGHEIEYIKVR